METMQWSEISATSSSQTSAGVVNGAVGNDQHQHHNSHHNHVPGGPGVAGHGGSENGLGGGTLGAPTIKNHSVTYFNDHLYCFGGYDGRRNHNLLLLYNIKEQRWIRPQAVQDDGFNNNNNNNGSSSSSRNNIVSDSSDDSATRVNHQGSTSTSTSTSNNKNISRRRETDFEVDDSDETRPNDTGNEDGEDNSGGNNQNDSTSNDDSNNDSAPEQINQSQKIQNRQQALLQQHAVAFDNNPYNRNNNHDGFYPGIGDDHDPRNKNNKASTYAYTVTGNPPPGRNGHSATLATDEDDDEDEQRGDITGRIIVLGGWLGQGPLAASDMHVLDISRGGKTLRWYQPAVKGTPPGPCNMHSADYVKARKEVFVFRGGNGTFSFLVNYCFILSLR
jgi:hypothetical protein